MALTFSLAPVPFWYFSDLTGKPLSGGKMYTKSSLNPTEDKPVYKTADVSQPYTNPVVFNENGTQGPFYWLVDSANPDDNYFLQIFDSNNNLVYQINNYNAVEGSGGGGSITTNIPLKNYLVNNSFLYNLTQTTAPRVLNGTVLAPGAFGGFITPDIIFTTDSTAAIDSISFIQFPLGSNPLTSDVAPHYYLNYQSNGAVGGTVKAVQFPVQPDVNVLANQSMTLKFWSMASTNGQILRINIVQYFGTGGAPSPTFVQQVGSFSLTTAWAPYVLNFPVPSVATKNRGSTGDDGTYLQFSFPVGSMSNISLAKPSLYLGNISPPADFDSDPQIDSIIFSPRTGYVQNTFSAFTPSGWVLMNNGTIGKAGSAATTRANLDTWFLYRYLWLSIPDAYCPVSGGRGVSPQADWDANKTITLPLSVNRVLANADPVAGHPLGIPVGTDEVTLTLGQMPNHNHNLNGGFSGLRNSTRDPGTNALGNEVSNVTGNRGNNEPHPNIQPTTYALFIMKL